MGKEYSDYLKFIDDALELAKAIPKYFSKFSNRIYCNHQKLAIYALMQKFKTTTRGITSILRASSGIRIRLGLTRIPVHTTIVRFVNKIKKQITKLLGIRQAVNTAVDATGFELESKSFYYRNIDKSLFSTRRKTKRFMKLNIAVDTDKQLILTHKIRKSCAHESKDFKFLLKELKVDYVMADKGYSSRKNRQFVINKLKAIPVIPYKKNEKSYHFKKSKLIFDDKKYHQRSKVETIFFAIKKKYGSVLRNRSCATQKVELISKLIAYNLDRMQLISLLIQRVAPAPHIEIFKYKKV